MKKVLIVFLSLLLVCSAATPAAARTFSSLSELQQYIEKHAPADMTGTLHADLEGTITEITWCGTGNHWQLLLKVEDPQAIPPIGSDAPLLIVHFRLHKDSPPFQVGDSITVSGSVNSLYSSVIMPLVLADYINGSDDF